MITATPPQRSDHEPVITDIGFKSNRRGGWWFREPSNAYTLQIVSSGLPLEHVRVATSIRRDRDTRILRVTA